MKHTQAYQGIFFNILKFGLAFGTLWFIVYKLVYAYQIGELWQQASTFSFTIHTCLLSLAILGLMPLNWLLEAQKWKLIIGKHEPVTNTKAYKSVLVGITLGIITPNQIGELAGKSIYLESLPKLKGAVANLVGGIAQIVSTFVIGSYGLLALFFHFNDYSLSVTITANIVLTLVNLGCVIAFVNINQINLFQRWKKLHEYTTVMTQYRAPELLQLLVYSALRFLTFSFQYYLLLHVFGIHLSIIQWIQSIFSLFVFQIVAPSFIIIQIGVRGALALYFIGFFTTNTVAILQASYTLWMINMMIPGLCGLLLLLTLKRQSIE